MTVAKRVPEGAKRKEQVEFAVAVSHGANPHAVAPGPVKLCYRCGEAVVCVPADLQTLGRKIARTQRTPVSDVGHCARAQLREISVFLRGLLTCK